MDARSLAVLLLISAGCGADENGADAPVDDAGSNDDSDAGSEESYEDASVEPECRTHSLEEEADARVIAALCIAITQPGEFGCTERSETSVVCAGLAGNIVVEFEGKVGTARYATAPTTIGTVSGDGPFDLSLSDGKTGECSVEGAVVELCI